MARSPAQRGISNHDFVAPLELLTGTCGYNRNLNLPGP
jgi:hypothetical protein